MRMCYIYASSIPWPRFDLAVGGANLLTTAKTDEGLYFGLREFNTVRCAAGKVSDYWLPLEFARGGAKAATWIPH
jgi:hypothetical protein